MIITATRAQAIPLFEACHVYLSLFFSLKHIILRVTVEPETLHYAQVIHQLERLVVILLLNKQGIYFIAQLLVLAFHSQRIKINK